MQDIDAVILKQENEWKTKLRWFAVGFVCALVLVGSVVVCRTVMEVLALFMLG